MTASPDLRANAPGYPSESVDKLGTILDGKYRLDARLGDGAIGIVYRATHLGLKKTFALKLLKPGPALDPSSVARFQREAEALGRLRHPHIVEVTDFGIDSATGSPYLVMELLDGSPLSDLCRQGPLPLDRALPILDAIAAAIDAAHDQGILHRDLKPGNVLLGGLEGEDRTVKVLDFGLAEIAAAPHPLLEVEREDLVSEETVNSLTATGSLLGTPLYIAPELIRHARASRASDIYSFGVIAYEMLAGRPPFQGSTAAVLAGHLEREPPAGALSTKVWSALRDSLTKDPARRPATACEVVRRLRTAAGREEWVRWRRTEVPRRIFLSTLLAAAVAVAGLLLPPAGVPPLERWAYDLRVRAAPARPPDPRILLITFDDASLADKPVPLADRADEIGTTLDRIFEAGARSVAVDFLLPNSNSWRDSPGFSDLVLRHPDTLTLAAFSNPEGEVLGPGGLAGLTGAALGPRRTSEIFGFVNLDEDPDGVVRRGRLWFRDISDNRRPSWAAKAACGLWPVLPWKTGTAQSFWIDTRIDWPHYERISWREVPEALDQNPELFRNRLVLVGGEFRGSGDDRNQIPHRSGRSNAVSGLILQALMVDTIGAGLPIREPSKTPILAVTILGMALAMAGILFARRAGPIVAGLAAGAGVYLALSFPIFRQTGLMLPVTAPLLLLLIGLLVSLVMRRNLPKPPEVSVS